MNLLPFVLYVAAVLYFAASTGLALDFYRRNHDELLPAVVGAVIVFLGWPFLLAWIALEDFR